MGVANIMTSCKTKRVSKHLNCENMEVAKETKLDTLFAVTSQYGDSYKLVVSSLDINAFSHPRHCGRLLER